jgi:hypothetical protein
MATPAPRPRPTQPRVTGTDSELLSDGYYTCHLRALGQSPEALGISDLITTHAYTYLCPAYDR